MKRDLLEYIKAASLVIIAVSLGIIAWNYSKEVSYLRGIEDELQSIVNAVHNIGQ